MEPVTYAPESIRTLPSWLLGRAAARGHRLVAEALAAEGMRMMHHAVLATVAELGPISQAELGRTLNVDPTEMVALTADLLRDGLIDRTRDPRDRRRNAVTLTAGGAAKLKRTAKRGREANQRLTSDLSDEEVDQLRSLLARLQ
jgi:MarR family transcriptional regulator, lower aerobic nicotinate degradation pathway regulator